MVKLILDGQKGDRTTGGAFLSNIMEKFGRQKITKMREGHPNEGTCRINTIF